MRYKIYLDTNQIRSGDGKGPLGEPFNTNIAELRKFLTENEDQLKDVEICLPEIVIRERIQHRIEDIAQNVSAANAIITALKSAGYTISEIELKDDHKELLERNADSYIKKYKVTRVPPPEVGKDELIERAITKMKPFKDNTAGFKDTLIYYSIIEDAVDKGRCADRYIFCTNDKGFTSEVCEEFRERTGKELYLAESISQVQERLDKLVPLHLELENRNKELRNLIMKNIGDLMDDVNKSLAPVAPLRPWSYATRSMDDYTVLSSSFSPYRSNQSEEDIVGYNYGRIDFNDYRDIGDGTHQVDLDIVTEIKYRDNSSVGLKSSMGWDGTVANHSAYEVLNMTEYQYPLSKNYLRSTNKTFNIQVLADLESEKIEVLGLFKKY